MGELPGFCEQKLSHFLFIYLRVQLLSHLIALWLTFWKTDKLFSLTAAQQCVRAPVFPHSSMLVILFCFSFFKPSCFTWSDMLSHCAFYGTVFKWKLLNWFDSSKDSLWSCRFSFLHKNASKLAISWESFFLKG